ncbi:Selenoprotein O [Trichoplax sp. H2]|nr:Selenoprotein O [Trichoplax sp. H2]|eukprot:RDD45352.1 Selenoprotein O [Trichoplax sp. H2]
MSATLETLNFDNSCLRCLPVENNTEVYPRNVAGACFSYVQPTPVDNPQLVAVSPSAMALLDLSQYELERSEFVHYFSGNLPIKGSRTAAHCYCGHQFGYFSGQLGDGAAMYIGEVVNHKDERWEIQFKGSGLTPYSRHADGRKVLRSSIREFLCSEAMHHLGIPTTRAGSCITSDSEVLRDIYYSGNPIKEKATVILRIAPTFLRFGSFEIFKPLDKITGSMGPSVGRKDILIQLLEYTINTHFPHVAAKYPDNDKERYLAFFEEVVKATAKLVALWQCVGFCHGVLNTDNMSIAGITIDYGPFGFLDVYDPDYVCNASDDGGRYAFINQPEVCKWNLSKLAEALASVLPLADSNPVLEKYNELFHKFYLEKMRLKLGLIRKQLPGDEELVKSLLQVMKDTGADFTNSFRCLNKLRISEPDRSFSELKACLLSQCTSLKDLKKRSKPSMPQSQLNMLISMIQANPNLITQMGQTALRIKNDLEKLEKLRDLNDLTEDEKRQSDNLIWDGWLKKYQCRLHIEVEHLDVDAIKTADKERIEVMNSNNPRFILRNYIAHNAIIQAEKGDYSEIRRVLKLLQNPYSSQLNENYQTVDYYHQTGQSNGNNRIFDYDGLPPEWSHDLRVT